MKRLMKILGREDRMTDAKLVDDTYRQTGIDLFEGKNRPEIVTPADLAGVVENENQ